MKPVAAAVIRQNGRILILRRKQGEKMAGYWEFPGGKCEPGETPAEALKRELIEELGLEASVNNDPIAEAVFTYPHGSFRIIALEAKITGGEMTLSVHDKAEWVLPEKIASYNLLPADYGLVEKINNNTLPG